METLQVRTKHDIGGLSMEGSQISIDRSECKRLDEESYCRPTAWTIVTELGVKKISCGESLSTARKNRQHLTT